MLHDDERKKVKNVGLLVQRKVWLRCIVVVDGTVPDHFFIRLFICEVFDILTEISTVNDR